MTNSNPQRAAAPPIWFLALCTASAVVGLTLLSPALPLIKTELNVSSEAVQQLLSVYMIALAFGQLVYGPVSDRFGRRPVLLFGAVLFSFAGIATLFSQNINQLIVLRGIQGFGAAACIAMGRAIVNDVFKRDEAARQMSTISMVVALAPALSLAFGGIVAEAAGWKGAMAVLAFSGVVVFISGFLLAKETNFNPTPKINIGSVFTAYSSVLRNRIFLAWAMAGGMQIGIFFSLNGFLAYQYQRNGYSMAEFGLWFALTPISYLVGNTANRRWFVKQGIERAALIGCTLSFIAVLSLFITQSMGLTHALSLALPCSLFGFSNGIIIANSTVGAISAAGKHIGTGSGIVGSWQMASGGIAGAIIVALGGAQEFSIAAGILIIMSAIAVMSMVYVYRRS
ncbi:multidrug effflux MFS transporter [Granulosicoccus sp.]|nr:multidrug effflux MFS transporter [Granulosicoccus sp.]MDB4222762.1 multidrug effflux MFS transporter [Granulosicoccus sp.]